MYLVVTKGLAICLKEMARFVVSAVVHIVGPVLSYSRDPVKRVPHRSGGRACISRGSRVVAVQPWRGKDVMFGIDPKSLDRVYEVLNLFPVLSAGNLLNGPMVQWSKGTIRDHLSVRMVTFFTSSSAS